MKFFSDNENFERGPPRHAGGNGNQGINFVWPYIRILITRNGYVQYLLILEYVRNEEMIAERLLI